MDRPGEGGVLVQCLQGAQGPQRVTTVLSKSCSFGLRILEYSCRAVLDKLTQRMSIFLFQEFGVPTDQGCYLVKMEQNDGDFPLTNLFYGFHKDTYHDNLPCLVLFLTPS